MRTDLQVLASAHLAEGSDPITAFITHDWASLGGWSLFIGLCLFAVTGAVREWWVPGARYRRLEEASKKLAEANAALLKQNESLLKGADLTQYFFQEVLPRKGARNHDVEPS